MKLSDLRKKLANPPKVIEEKPRKRVVSFRTPFGDAPPQSLGESDPIEVVRDDEISEEMIAAANYAYFERGGRLRWKIDRTGLDATIYFGKHNDRPISAIPLDYLEWMYKKWIESKDESDSFLKIQLIRVVRYQYKIRTGR